eukprot:1142184-Pelagomonas_calceolata.AAC.4
MEPHRDGEQLLHMQLLTLDFLTTRAGVDSPRSAATFQVESSRRRPLAEGTKFSCSHPGPGRTASVDRRRSSVCDELKQKNDDMAQLLAQIRGSSREQDKECLDFCLPQPSWDGGEERGRGWNSVGGRINDLVRGGWGWRGLLAARGWRGSGSWGVAQEDVLPELRHSALHACAAAVDILVRLDHLSDEPIVVGIASEAHTGGLLAIQHGLGVSVDGNFQHHGALIRRADRVPILLFEVELDLHDT